MYKPKEPYLVHRLQNHAARLMLGNFANISFHSTELVKSLGLHTIEERRDYFLAMLMFKSIHGIAPAYLCNQMIMKFAINGFMALGVLMACLFANIKEKHLQTYFCIKEVRHGIIFQIL